MQTLKKEGLRMANFSILSVFKPVGLVLLKNASIEGGYFR